MNWDFEDIFFGFLKLIAVLFFLLLAYLVTGGCFNPNPGKGNMIGTITWIDKVGLRCKTYEARIRSNGFESGTGNNGESYSVTITDTSLIPLMQTYMERRVAVNLQYNIPGIYRACTSGSGTLIEKVTPLK